MSAVPTPSPSPVKLGLLVFGFLCCLYAVTAGGQGYSVDGTFSYEVARSLAVDPARDFAVRHRDTLRRWGPVMPAVGVPFAWAGAVLGAAAPWPDTVVVDGRLIRLYDWAPVGPAGSGYGTSLTLRLPERSPVGAVQIVSFLSFATDVPDGAVVAEVSAGSGSGVIRAGRETSEWAYDMAGVAPPRHRRAPVAGYWPGNPAGLLYAGTVPIVPAATGDSVTLRYTAPVGRLHLRALLVVPGAETADAIVPAGPPLWSAERQVAFFTRFGFSFVNVPLIAATAALLVPLARLLGYSIPAAAALAIVFGTATLAWPYAKHDFAEPAAGAFALAATTLAFLAAGSARRARRRALLIAAGACLALSAGAKYSAAWFAPLLAAQVAILTLRQRSGAILARLRCAALDVAALLAAPVCAGAVVLLLAGSAPLIWTGWRSGLERGWLDFPLWAGVYGLLLSPGKGLLLYAPPLLLALAGVPFFVRRHGGAAFLFVAVPLTYLAVFGSKGVWHGGGWGPRYLLPALPFMVCLALPVFEALFRPAASPAQRLLWGATLALALAGAGVQVLGVAKHPNSYTVMFRDHVLPALPDYGAPLGGPAALAYWRHFGGPAATRQLERPSAGRGDMPAAEALSTGVVPQRALGYAYAESGDLALQLRPGRDARFDLSLYLCDWDRRGRRQRIVLDDSGGRREYVQRYDFAGCEYLTWRIDAAAGSDIRLSVTALGPDVPVISALFFDPPAGDRRAEPRRDPHTGGRWTGRYGADGFALLAWQRGGRDVTELPDYLTALSGGDRVWIDTGEAELADTALLYVPAFSPLVGHAWLLANDAVTALRPHDLALRQRALASPPWRVMAGMDVMPPHPEYGLGLDLWQLRLRDLLRSHGGFMAMVWGVTVALAAGGALCASALVWEVRRALCPSARKVTRS